ncbi:deoxyribodipyrimidine photo-lyase [Dactylosporangium vinaceum]|uniref:Cryptochrome/photolyase family protein n=1 Tax=Dactylosporangium vinaceum TaxID=53362 RepID=A0ABV5MR64_9ACTN|nr:deoxyribodipyrimidine photo-lyase [Dactylosporangium vinaceum]UAB96538.1 deoxyribodipyrimidine photo-lyase [Dactylosporangium vinaceum]
MKTCVVLFTRDLRVHDNPAFASSVGAFDVVLPLFVHDPALPAGDNRRAFLRGALDDLRSSLRARGGDLAELHGDPVTEAIRAAKTVGASAIAMAADVSAYARSRETRLAAACESERLAFKTFPGVTVVPPSAVRPGGGGSHYKVFTPYYRSWEAFTFRDVVGAPKKVSLPADAPKSWFSTAIGDAGETAARKRLSSWLADIAAYGDIHDDLAADRTSRLSPYLHFGCLSPREVVDRAQGQEGAEPFIRQLCWRDFYHQVLAAFPALKSKPYRANAEDEWRDEKDALQAWQEGHTGMPIVDAGMRQLRAEGWMHNRARLITASYLTKHLYVDWRAGGDHFFDLLLDGDVANNYGNWQWVAGTGNDTKPYRRFSPLRQAERFDPTGEYVRRYVPELAHIPGKAIHQPWELPAAQRRGYPAPIK